MKILLLGKDGQVGSELQRTLLPLGELVCMGRAQADLQDIDALRKTLLEQRPGLIVNAAAYTAVDRAESDEAAAMRINAEAVEVLARHAADHDAALVHYSTDYVYDGSKDGPYLETDPTGPQSVYGRSKLEGELAIARSGCRALVLRTSWVYSRHGGNFLKTMLRLAAQRESLTVVADQIGAPTSAELIADVTAHAVAALQRQAMASGVYHLTAGGSTSWHAYAQHVVARARHNGAPLKLHETGILPIPAHDYPTAATRPANSRLDTGKLCQALGLHMPHWKVHVDRATDQLTRMESA